MPKEVNKMNETISELQLILKDLLQLTDASRTTVRMDIPEQNSNMDVALVEALAPGIDSIKSLSSLVQRKLPTVIFMDEKRINLIQEDCANAEVSPPKDLISAYGVKAQMLGPLVWEQELFGFISVHYIPSIRHWSQQDIAALDDAKQRVIACLKQAQWLS
jgi:maleate isomerase